MKSIIAGLFFLCISFETICFAQTNSISAKNTSEQEIINMSKNKWQWMADKKTDTLAHLFHDKAVFVHMGGSWGKERELEVIQSVGIWYKKAEIYSASVNIIGNTAILLNDIDLVAEVGGNEVINPYMVTEVYLNENGKWQMGSLTFSRLMRPVKLSKAPVLEKIWESDTLTLNGPESVLFDAASHTLYVSSMNAGSVVQMDTSGKVLQKEWIKGLQSNKGSALYNGLYYTAETSGIAIIDMEKASVVKRIPVEAAQMLNDVAIDTNGILYVTDTRAGKVYRIEGEKVVLFLENLPGANGLFTIGSTVYVATSTSFLKVGEDKVVTTIADDFESGLDGIIMIAENEFIISNYKGMLYYVKADGTKKVLLDTREQKIMSNDISYNSHTKTLYAPSFSTNRVIAYRVH